MHRLKGFRTPLPEPSEHLPRAKGALAGANDNLFKLGQRELADVTQGLIRVDGTRRSQSLANFGR